LKFSPPVSNVFPLTKTKLPLDKFLLLVFKRVFILKILLSPPFEHNEIPILKIIPIEKLFLKLVPIEKPKFLNWWWCGPFALGSCSLPLWHKSPKTELLEPFPNYFLPFGKLKHE
jgi:hypothetical protein